ncbi:MAG: winged helix-turn-helix transcriptional regulator [Clostridia bacterium]|nr:winged helix-turn-helix transcriptional regulator [Clostridia bacterium]
MEDQELKRNLPGEPFLTEVADFFKVMGDPTRVRILWALDQGEICVCELAELLEMTVSAISHQLQSLRGAKLVKSRRQGKHIFYSLDDEHVRDVFETAIQHLAHKK